MLTLKNGPLNEPYNFYQHTVFANMYGLNYVMNSRFWHMTLIVMLMGKYHILLQEEIAINSSLLMRKLATSQLLETWIEKWYVTFLIV